MAPELFSTFSTMVINAFHDCDTDICLDCTLLSLRRLQAKPKVQTDVLNEPFYVDDRADNAKTQEKKCKGLWKELHKPLTFRCMTSQSAQKRLWQFTSQHLEIRTMNQT